MEAWTVQLVSGMADLQRQHIAHNDIKPVRPPLSPSECWPESFMKTWTLYCLHQASRDGRVTVVQIIECHLALAVSTAQV